MISCYIVADFSMVEILCAYIEKFPLTHFIGHSSADSIGLNTVFRKKPAIVFVDAKLLSTHRLLLLQIANDTTVVYLSTNQIEAFQAFDALAFDYLTVPLKFERFEMSINKFIRFSLLSPHRNESRTSPPITDSFFVRADTKGQKEMLIKCTELVFIKAMQNYVVLHMTDNRQIICHNTMKEMEDTLPVENFVRVHKSFIINYDKLTYVEGNNIILNGDERCTVLIGISYRKQFMDLRNKKTIRKKSVQPMDFLKIASLFVAIGQPLSFCTGATINTCFNLL